MKKKKERLKMCEDIYPKITVLIYFNSMSYFKTKAEKNALVFETRKVDRQTLKNTRKLKKKKKLINNVT